MNIVFDLDGTLADTSHRVHYLEQTPKDWKAFYATAVDDPRIDATCRVFLALRMSLREEHGDHMAIWTARPDRYRSETVSWLQRAGLLISSPFAIPVDIRMRESDDFREDTVVKGEWLKESPWRPDLVFEDRARMVEFWRSQGITCYQVASGNF